MTTVSYQEISYTLWNLPLQLNLSFTEEQLVKAGFPEVPGNGVNIEMIAEVFRCNVTRSVVDTTTVHFQPEGQDNE